MKTLQVEAVQAAALVRDHAASNAGAFYSLHDLHRAFLSWLVINRESDRAPCVAVDLAALVAVELFHGITQEL